MLKITYTLIVSSHKIINIDYHSMIDKSKRNIDQMIPIYYIVFVVMKTSNAMPFCAAMNKIVELCQ